MGASQVSQREPKVLRIFISYASEDLQIALAIATGLKKALGGVFAEIWIDKWYLKAGIDYRLQIQQQLKKTDVLMIVYSGEYEKQSHGFTGWEVGFFEALKFSDGSGAAITPLFLDRPPDSVAGYQGVSLNVPKELLRLSSADFRARQQVDASHPMCQLVRDLQERVAEITKQQGFAHVSDDRPSAVECVQEMRLAIFNHLKSTIETTLKPQKQIIVRCPGGTLNPNDLELPDEAILRPFGSGSPMEIFGMPNEEMTWAKFLSSAELIHVDAWREAISNAIISSLPDRLNVDNSHLVLSSDNSKIYRVILTTAIKYWDESREFHLYFVEGMRRPDYGDPSTTLLLKGLELVCRYRSMFLEDTSEFSPESIRSTPENQIYSLACELLRELTLMNRDLRIAKLEEPRTWRKLVGVDWGLIEKMGESYRPQQAALRDIIAKIMTLKDQKDQFRPLRDELSATIAQMVENSREYNDKLVQAMAAKLVELTNHL